MTRSVTFCVPGHPQGKGRARSVRRGNFIAHYTPEKTRSYESIIRGCAYDAMAKQLPMDGPVEVVMTAIFDIPGRWSIKKRTAALFGDIKPTKKPDIDNIIKAVVDACNGIVFKDDCQIVRGQYAKSYGPQPLIAVTVTAL